MADLREWITGFLLGCGVRDTRVDEYAGKLLASGFIEAVRAEEREKAAQIAEDVTLFQVDGELANRITRGIAAQIRAQGKEQGS